MRSVTLPSGAVLSLAAAPFAEARALYQALLRNFQTIRLDASVDLKSVFKDIFCVGFSSPEIERCLWPCLQRCIYDSGAGALKIDKDTFEPVANRQDYMKVCVEVARENVDPFVQSLYAEFKHALSMIEKGQT